MLAWSILLPLLALAAAAAALWYRRRYHALQWQAARMQTEIRTLLAGLQQAAHSEEAQREALFNSMVEGVLLLDTQQRVRLVNRTLRQWFDWSGDPADRSLIELFRDFRLQDRVQAALSGRQESGFEMELPGKMPRILQANVAAVKDLSGKVQGIIVVFHDLSPLKRLEVVRRDFVANVSHELRTPLSMIRGAAETLCEGAGDDPEARRRFQEMIRKHASRLSLLIEDLLVLSQMDSGRVSLDMQSLELAEVVPAALDDLQASAAERPTAIRNRIPCGLAVRADRNRLLQILYNLLDNAVKYGRPNGQIILSAESGRDGMVTVRVQDDGPGIPAEYLEWIFERFFRLDRARSRNQGGTGLGLSIVKHLVQAHGGKVWAVSPPTGGTVFCFTLPQAGRREEGSDAAESGPA